MNDARTEILRAARELFLEQGFVQTTIQQLADHVGISKGAVYLHFRSKADVMTSLMRSLEEAVLERVQKIAASHELSPLERLREQLRLQFEEVREQRLLFEIYMKDSGVAIDEELALFAQKSRVEWQLLQEDFVRQAFPAVDERFVTDVAVCLSGALNEYYSYVFLEAAEVDPDAVADLLVVQAGALAKALAATSLAPVLDRGQLRGKEEIDEALESAAQARIDAALQQIEAQAGRLPDSDAAEIEETLEALRHGMAQETPSRVVLQGLLANLRDFKGLSQARKTLAYELGLKLV
ncbi:MAG: TetR family transcriptional regulator [Acidobacteriota bacterium]